MLIIGACGLKLATENSPPPKSTTESSMPAPPAAQPLVYKSIEDMSRDVEGWTEEITRLIERGERPDHKQLATLINSAYWGFYAYDLHRMVWGRIDAVAKHVDKKVEALNQQDSLQAEKIAELERKNSRLNWWVILLGLGLLGSVGTTVLLYLKLLRKIEGVPTEEIIEESIKQEVARQLTEKREAAERSEQHSSMLILTSPCVGGADGALAKATDVIRKSGDLSRLLENAQHRHLGTPFSNPEDCQGWLKEQAKQLQEIKGEKWVVMDKGFDTKAIMAFAQTLENPKYGNWKIVRVSEQVPTWLYSFDGNVGHLV